MRGGFGGILIAGSRIARNAPNRFSMLLAFGCTALIVLPADHPLGQIFQLVGPAMEAASPTRTEGGE